MLMSEDRHVLRRVLEFDVEDQMKEGRGKMMLKKQVEGDSVNVGLRFADQCGRLVLIRMPLGGDMSSHPHLLGI